MDIRSITCFVNIDAATHGASAIAQAGEAARQTRQALEAQGLTVQSARLATQPLSLLPDPPLPLSSELWSRSSEAGFSYLSLGPVLADAPDADLSRLDDLVELVCTTETLFATTLVARRDQGIHLEAIRRTASIIRDIAHSTDLGFGNLRMAVLANVDPLAPFFPAAYHDGGSPALSIATESADLAVAAFSGARSVDEARKTLIAAVEAEGQRIAQAVQPVAQQLGFRFAGIDFSWAPFPEELRSIGTAVERLGVERFGAPGTLFVAALLTSCLRQARFPHCGFNGLMLPVLEDSLLAARSHERLFTVNDLLLYSSVCGTGLDTVPLPGDVGEEELAGILLDMATLALRLNKPLTARLMPIPGAQAGDLTEFDFSYFANGRVLDVKGLGSSGLFGREPWIAF
jgi:hypothetical protein